MKTGSCPDGHLISGENGVLSHRDLGALRSLAIPSGALGHCLDEGGAEGPSMGNKKGPLHIQGCGECRRKGPEQGGSSSMAPGLWGMTAIFVFMC